MSEIINVPMTAQRDIRTVTVEINTLHRQAQAMTANYAIEIGRRLCEVKEMLKHGEWGDWLKTEVPFSASTAQKLMRIFKEFGAEQIGFFGDANSQAIVNLDVTKLGKLILIGDEEERTEFLETHDVAEMSTRELEQAIRERDAAKAAAEDAEKKAKQYAGDAENHFKTAQELQKKLDAAEEKAKKAKDSAAKERADAMALRDQLKQAKENPEVPAGVVKKIKTEAMEQAAAEAEKKVLAAQTAAEEAEREAEELRKQLSVADSTVAVFGERFQTVQVDFNNLHSAFEAVKEKDESKAEKLRGAVNALMDKLMKEVEAW